MLVAARTESADFKPVPWWFPPVRSHNAPGFTHARGPHEAMADARRTNRAGRKLRSGQDVVRSTSPPNDVNFARPSLRTVLKCRTSVPSPRHLEDSRRAPNRLDSQTFAEPSGLQVQHKLPDRSNKGILLFPAQALEVAQESRQRLIRGHLAFASRLQVTEELLPARVALPASAG